MSVCWWTILTRSACVVRTPLRAQYARCATRGRLKGHSLGTRQRSQGQQTLPPWFLHLGPAGLKPRTRSFATHYKYPNSKHHVMPAKYLVNNLHSIQLSNRWRMHRITFQGLLMKFILISTFKCSSLCSRDNLYINDLQWTRKRLKSSNQGLQRRGAERECSSGMKMETSFHFSHSWPRWHLWHRGQNI